jgi:sporulation protein YlmC with PRC-barrel domain
MRAFVILSILSLFSAGVMTPTPWVLAAELQSQARPFVSPITSSFSQRHETTEPSEQGRHGRLLTHGGTEIGELSDFLVAPDTGGIAYGVFALTGREHDPQTILLPWGLIELDPEEPASSSFRLRVAHALLDAAPRVSHPRWEQPRFVEGIDAVDRYWAPHAAQQYATPRAASRLVKASDVIGMRIRREDGAAVGTLRELIVDGEQGRIASAVVVREDPGRVRRRMFLSLPWTTLHVPRSGHTLVAHLGAKTAI